MAPQLRRSRRLAAALKAVPLATPEEPVVLDHVAEAGQPLYLAAVISAWREAGELDSAVWVLCAQVKTQEVLQSEIGVWGHEALFLPEYEWAGFEETLPDPESAAERLAVLKEIHEITREKGDAIVVLTADSLAEGAPPPGSLSRQAEKLRPGDTLDLAAFAAKLEQAGYEPEAQVFQRGQFALRGGIIDVFSWQALHPVRIELFGEEIESIREFDVDAQTSIERIGSCEILLSEANLEQSGRIADYIGEKDLLIAVDCESELAHVRILSGASSTSAGAENFDGACFDNPLGEFGAGDFILQEVRREEFSRQIAAWRKEKWTVLMAFHSDGEKERFTELIFENAWNDGFLKPVIGTLSRGFTIPDAKLAVLSDAEIFGRYQNQRGRRRYRLARELQASQQVNSLREYNYGDLVVHIDYGIGKFRGIRTRESAGSTQEVLEIEYEEEARLFVALDQAHLVSRYIGTGKKAPKLSRLGDKRWSRLRRDAENSILDYAGRLLSIQAERAASQRGFAHPPDNKWQWEFEHAFIYKETPDQLRAIEETKADMESPKPMDRLICGDVGFGKTEVAIRAAFKAVMSGKQVVILAPTTVLAEQHFRNFRERMSDFPVKIETLSRYRTATEQRRTLVNLAAGSTDIVIGTHRVISKDVRFKDLGLVVVDEEQRFGVHHKERFKEMWRFVDVLTLSATPIPRTLYLSMMGVREMSVIDTPPPNRRPVATTVCPYDERIIRSAIEKELLRQGQVFFLHNRVKSIEGVKRRIEDLVPGARVGIGHGQMESDELEDVMSRFIRHEFDVLVCTTIIESGVDIPNANTIIIDRADRFGLADLYQIRGRVGRADRRAYAYLMLPPDMLTVGDARKRINAIKQYSSLGAGFKIAMRDLEIRGAGNLLGTQQSGHIAAIGFDLYCQLLRQSVAKLKGEPSADRVDLSMHIDFLRTNEASYHKDAEGLPAFLPAAYMPEARLRITAYRELAEAARVEDLEVLRENWTDRFGALPPPAVHLLTATEVKIRAARKGCATLEIQEGKLKLTKNGKYIQINGKFPRLIGDNEEEWLESALDWVLDL